MPLELDAHQEDVLITLVEASRRGSRQQPGFVYTEPPGGRPHVEHPGLREDLVLARADIDIFARRGLLIHRQIITGSGSFELTPDAYRAYEEVQQHRTRAAAPASTATVPSHDYVAASRIGELRAIHNAAFDLTRLIRLCEELNITWSQNAYHATAMLVRSVLDHVPPVFGVATFAQVANNYAGTKSFKETMAALESSARKIADLHLHTQIRRSEVLPTAPQVKLRRVARCTPFGDRKAAQVTSSIGACVRRRPTLV